MHDFPAQNGFPAQILPIPALPERAEPERAEAAPFLIEHRQEDAVGSSFRPSARLILTERLRTSGLWRSLTAEDFANLALILSFVTPNGWCRPTLPELADAMNVPPAKAKIRLDRVMPALRDTELRVLLVVVRQTLGWQLSPGSTQRKDRDWLTQSQLMRRTGRASEAVSRAVDALVRAGLIGVVDRAGMPVRTPAERRRHIGHLYFQLGSGVRNASKIPKSEHAKGHTTKETQVQKYRADDKNVDNSGESLLSPEAMDGNVLLIHIEDCGQARSDGFI